MEIIIDSTESNQKNDIKYNYSFTHITDVKLFPNIYQKEVVKRLEKWGIANNMELVKYRYNINFDNKDLDQFLLDFFNSKEVRNSFPGLSSIISSEEALGVIDKIKYKKLTTKSIDLNCFDVLYESGLVNKSSGYIKKDYEEYYEDILLSDKLKAALINEEAEFYSVFDEELRNELIFSIFQKITIGGSLCQYEDYIQDYLDTTKLFYKDLVSAARDQTSKEIYIRSIAFEIKALNNLKLFKNEYNPQNFMILTIDPYQRHVNVWLHKWVLFW